MDHTGTTGVVTFVDGSQANLSFETTLGRGDSAEFFAILRNDRPRIRLVRLDASGSPPWGVDDIEYGVIPLPAPAWLLGYVGLGRRVARA